MSRNDQPELGPTGAGEEESSAEAEASIGMLAEFTKWATALGVVVERLQESANAARVVAQLAREAGAERMVIAAELAQAAPELIAALDNASSPWRMPGEAAETQHEQFGVSLGHLAIAETGSVLMAESSLNDRAVGMLVAVQVIVCRTASLVPSLDDAAAVLRELALRPSGGYTTLVTGPSRTADIERVLTVGVQGPGRLIVLFVDELS